MDKLAVIHDCQVKASNLLEGIAVLLLFNFSQYDYDLLTELRFWNISSFLNKYIRNGLGSHTISF